MTKQELIKAVEAACPARYPRAVIENVVENLGKVAVRAALEGDEVTIPGLAKVSVVTRAPRAARNPKTGATVMLPERQKLKFKPVASAARATSAAGAA